MTMRMPEYQIENVEKNGNENDVNLNDGNEKGKRENDENEN